MMRQLKCPIDKETLISYLGEKERQFLDKIDRLNEVELSIGKWNKLYAMLAEVRQKTSENYFVYSSPNLYDYDTSCHRKYLQNTDPYRTDTYAMVHADPKKEKKYSIK